MSETGTADSNPAQDLALIVGRHFIYTYANGWQYEMYVKNATTIDYRIHSGMVGGRWVKDQSVDLVRLDDDNYKVSWHEPTGTSVCVNLMPQRRRIHGTIFFPRWVHANPELTVCFQNDYLAQMREYRDRGPTYPVHVVSELAQITFVENCGPEDDTVIAAPPQDLPADYVLRTN